MSERDIVTLKLPRIAVSQILDGLAIRAEQWEYTQRFLETGFVEDDIFATDSDDPDEAVSIAAYYRQTIKIINDQIAAPTV